VALHEAVGVGTPIADDAQYERMLAFIDEVFDEVSKNPAHPLGGLVELMADRIRAYEERAHPWPDTSTPATVLASLMEEHGLTQSDLPEVGAQSVVSAVLAGKRKLNLRQVKALSQRFAVPIEMLA
jgi:HTH-type transcriptional regulator/antitoxin HigA